MPMVTGSSPVASAVAVAQKVERQNVTLVVAGSSPVGHLITNMSGAEMNPEKEILKLRDGESWTWPESDYGKAEIWFKNGTYFLFEIPSFGGEPRFFAGYKRSTLVTLINIVESWT